MNRKRNWIYPLIVFFLAMAFVGCTQPPASSTGVEIGRPAPKFRLPDLEGKEVALDDFKGKIVLLDFWATWCGPCRMTMPMMENLEREYAGSMVLLAVNLQDSKEEILDYVRTQSIGSRILRDEEGTVGTAYGTYSIPMHFLIDQDGILRHVQAGFGPGTVSELRAEIESLRR